MSVGTYDSLLSNVVITMKHLLEQPEKPRDLPATRQCKRFYHSCMNFSHTNDHQGLINLRMVAQTVNGLSFITSHYDARKLQLEDIYSYSPVYPNLFRHPPFVFSVNPDKLQTFKTFLLEVSTRQYEVKGILLPTVCFNEKCAFWLWWSSTLLDAKFRYTCGTTKSASTFHEAVFNHWK